jgi:NAD(P)-dependent dehydrogenase (short-subunit alcohol dehydrogenase family)
MLPRPTLLFALQLEPEKLAPLDHDDELFERNLFLNLTSAYYATRAALPRMV